MEIPETPKSGLKGSAFWLTIIGVWLVMLTIAGTLALALAIWSILEAF